MSDRPDLLESLRAAVAEGRAPSPADLTRLALVTDPMVLRKAGKLLARLEDVEGLRPLRVAVLATCTIGSYEQILRASLVSAGVLPELAPGPYGMFELTLATDPFDGVDVITLLLDETAFLPHDWAATDVDGLAGHLEARLADLRGLVLSAVERCTATVLLHTVPLPAQVRDSVISWRARAALSKAWAKLNEGLLDLAAQHRQVAVTDLVSVLADSPHAARDDRLHRYGDLPYTDGALYLLAREVRRFAQVRAGLSRKVLALDLDNTLWGGVLGEVGAEGVQLGGLYPGNAYQEVQRTASRLRDQGVVLVLASKNDADLVDEALTAHPEVLLRPEAFSAKAVNWSPKAGNLREAASALGLGIGSFVFLDDSPFERGHVEEELPEVVVLAADGDPAHIVRTLLAQGWFDVAELTETDLARPELYRSRTLRNDFAGGFGSSEDYLHALQVRLVVEEADGFAVARVAQLAARTNQFNLTGLRFDEAETGRRIADPDHLVVTFAVADRFGDEGVIGAAWVDRSGAEWHVDNLVLSCRVLGRGVELAIAAWLARRAHAAGATALRGRYVPSKKNGLAKGFWTDAGFTGEGDGAYALALDSDTGLPGTPAWINLLEGNEVAR
ncbi:HAD-IIIC family phosphatase [Saccharothrix texasensis]|uniref:D-glyceryl-ACP synthase n=1 Tax=Saccharothrix texasensis TaxID=103734 RepID=A0A3N1H2I6_9PSEU|nr:HAD-IIIC family phosphatase [Saccharothrix texasensis]ROP36616.1 D-glyceryl-ACP synthase [Saccharothrix texasensis]